MQDAVGTAKTIAALEPLQALLTVLLLLVVALGAAVVWLARRHLAQAVEQARSTATQQAVATAIVTRLDAIQAGVERTDRTLIVIQAGLSVRSSEHGGGHS